MTSQANKNEALSGSSNEPAALTDILIASLEALAAAGQADAACRLAGKACAELRGKDPAGWQRFNVFLHRMIKHVS
jgi:hypothetical protein